jgi:hypothetical protein
MQVSGDFLRFFLVGGFAPSFVFVLLTDVLILPRFSPHRLGDITLFGSPLISYAIASAALGLLLMALNTSIVRLFEHGLLPRWARGLNRKRHDRRYSALSQRREDYFGATAAAARELAAIKLDGLHQKIERENPVQRLPYSRDHVMPTDLGNAFAVAEEYPYYRYGMDAMTFWTRLVAVIPVEYGQRLAEQKSTVDFLLNLSLLCYLFAVGSLGIGLRFLSVPEIVYSLVAVASGYLFYRLAVSSTTTLGETIKASFDLFRHDLLSCYGQELPLTIAEERKIWIDLASFIDRGEDFYYPPGRAEESSSGSGPSPEQ